MAPIPAAAMRAPWAGWRRLVLRPRRRGSRLGLGGVSRAGHPSAGVGMGGAQSSDSPPSYSWSLVGRWGADAAVVDSVTSPVTVPSGPTVAVKSRVLVPSVKETATPAPVVVAGVAVHPLAGRDEVDACRAPAGGDVDGAGRVDGEALGPGGGGRVGGERVALLVEVDVDDLGVGRDEVSGGGTRCRPCSGQRWRGCRGWRRWRTSWRGTTAPIDAAVMILVRPTGPVRGLGAGHGLTVRTAVPAALLGKARVWQGTGRGRPGRARLPRCACCSSRTTPRSPGP